VGTYIVVANSSAKLGEAFKAAGFTITWAHLDEAAGFSTQTAAVYTRSYTKPELSSIRSTIDC
jgi:hypothetical protein